MTPAAAPRIRRREPVAIIITVIGAVAGARPAITFLFYFGATYFWDLTFFVYALLGSSPLFPSTAGNYIECRQRFARHAIAQVPIAVSRGLSLG
jgi:hypothetical protein